MQWQNNKKVSVVMCTYNGALFLREQLESIVNQTYPIYELIIQDDCSSDRTLELLREYADKYSFIKVCKNQSSKGINDNFLSAIFCASGDYIAISDQDDIWELKKIEWQIASIGDAWLSTGISKPFCEGDDIKVYFNEKTPNICLERMIYAGMVPGHTMLLKRDFLHKMPNVDYWSKIYLYDHFIQMVAGAYEKISFCPKVLVHQRRHMSAATYGAALNYQKNMWNIFNSVNRTFKQYVKARPKMEDYFSNIHKFLMEIQVDTQTKRNALHLALYQSKHTIISYVRLVITCIQLRDKIFYSIETNPLFSIARAIYFPISSSDYFFYMVKKDLS